MLVLRAIVTADLLLETSLTVSTRQARPQGWCGNQKNADCEDDNLTYAGTSPDDNIQHNHGRGHVMIAKRTVI